MKQLSLDFPAEQSDSAPRSKRRREWLPKAQPFLKWAGGKRALLPELRKRVGKFPGRYFEAFLGGAALFFELAPRKAVLSDVNLRLVRCYRALRDDVEGLIGLLTEHAQQHCKEHYYAVRALDVDRCSDVELAAWLIYLNHTCFNGLYRVNKSNRFNVPMGRYVNPTICNAPLLRACSTALKHCEIEHLDFQSLSERPRAGDVVYFDPPYVPLSASSSFTSYSQEGFTDADQVRLRDTALELKRRGVRVILSNAWAPRVLELYAPPAFRVSQVMVPRMVNSKASGRAPVPEALIV
ncbi:MAG: Dam family site-specific DNA-(adenine-N6)-methyltransferase [Myxococcota bacterium]|nr:Dam family site-specific DNA-(adenine-N6)-methyltransferase [Myxococcota bacterium]